MENLPHALLGLRGKVVFSRDLAESGVHQNLLERLSLGPHLSLEHGNSDGADLHDEVGKCEEMLIQRLGQRFCGESKLCIRLSQSMQSWRRSIIPRYSRLNVLHW